MLRTFNWEMFRNERGACGSRCSSISVSGKEKAVEKLVWFSGESPEGRRNVDPLEGPPYWEGSLDFAAWASFASMLRKTGRVVGEVGLHLQQRPGIGATLERHPFSGLVDSAGELLHTP